MKEIENIIIDILDREELYKESSYDDSFRILTDFEKEVIAVTIIANLTSKGYGIYNNKNN